MFVMLLVLKLTSIEGIRRPALVCVYPSWSALRPGVARFLPEQLDPFLCTHVVYTYARLDEKQLLLTFGNSGLDMAANDGLDLFNRTTSLKMKNPRLKVLLCMGGLFDNDASMIQQSSEDNSKYNRMLTNSQSRRNFITHAVEFLKQYNFDGLNFHWEFPQSTAKNFLSAFVKECKREFRQQHLLLTLTISVVSSVVDNAYNLPVISKYCDQVYLMTYDFHGFYEGEVHRLSPLRSPYASSFSIEESIMRLEKAGLSVDKVVVGIATYAKSYELIDSEGYAPGSTSNGPGTPGPHTRTAGYLAYYETCNADWVKIEDETGEIGPYAYNDNQWVSFNDAHAVQAKAEFILQKGALSLIHI